MKFKNDIEKFEFFESFLNNRVPDAQKVEFEEALKQDSSLSAEFNEYQNLHELVIDNSVLEIKETLASIHQDARYGPGRKNGFSGNKILLTVISGVVLISATLFFFLREQETVKTEAEMRSEKAEQKTEPALEQNLNIENQESIMPVEKEDDKKATAQAITPILEEQAMVLDTLREEKKEIPEPGPVEATLIESAITDNEMEVPRESIEKAMNTSQKADNRFDKDEPEVIDCEKVKISLRFELENSCVEEVNSGKIKIDQNSISGGTSPYYFSINGGTDYYESRYLFNYLSPGSYQLFVRDLNHCEENIAEVIIEEDICIKDYKYSPALGDPWMIPVKKGKDGIFRMFSRSGQILVERRVDPYSDNAWYGNDNNDYPLAMGYFPFIIQYSDGEVFEGSVTLVK